MERHQPDRPELPALQSYWGRRLLESGQRPSEPEPYLPGLATLLASVRACYAIVAEPSSIETAGLRAVARGFIDSPVRDMGIAYRVAKRYLRAAKRPSKADKEATKKVFDYLHRYERNRPFNSSAFPNLLTNNLTGDGRTVLNHDDRVTVAVFTTPEAANAALLEVRRDYEKRTGKPWYQRG